MVKQKRRHWNKYKNARLTHHLDKYKEVRRLVKTETRKEYSCFFASAKQNSKNVWSFVNAKKKESRIPVTMTSDDSILTSPEDIVNAFGSLSASVFSKEKECL